MADNVLIQAFCKAPTTNFETEARRNYTPNCPGMRGKPTSTPCWGLLVGLLSLNQEVSGLNAIGFATPS